MDYKQCLKKYANKREENMHESKQRQFRFTRGAFWSALLPTELQHLEFPAQNANFKLSVWRFLYQTMYMLIYVQ